jgi:hypothetical protein
LKAVADDFVPIGNEGKACPLPVGFSEKKGAFGLFPEEDLIPLKYGGLKNSSWKYLYPAIKRNSFRSHPVRKIVFVNYDQGSSLTFSELKTVEALELFYREAYVNPGRENAEKFINWFAGIKCYSLKYGDAKDAMEKIKELFKK